MNHYDVQKSTALVGCEEMGGSAVLFDRKSSVVCPKPRRVGCMVNNPNIMSLRRHRRSLQELCDSKAGTELLDMILVQGANGAEKSPTGAAPSPPYFSGSPPSRVPNPLILDARFADAKPSPSSPLKFSAPSSPLKFSAPSSPTASPLSHKGGCARMSFGLKPAAVRVEGFDCLSRNRQNSGVTTVA